MLILVVQNLAPTNVLVAKGLLIVVLFVRQAHWPTHKESCDGRLHKMGMDHLNKARGFFRETNWLQLLRYSDLAATKLKQLKDRPIEDISIALSMKCTAMGFLGQNREQLECAKEWYCLWNTKPTDPPAIDAAFALIQSCMNCYEYADAHLYASTLWEIINHKNDNKIPDNQRQEYTAKGAYHLATAMLRLAKAGGIPLAEKQQTGQEAITLARRALEIHTQMYGIESNATSNNMVVLAEALDYFNNDGDDEVLRLFEQSIASDTRLFGSSSVNVAIGEEKLGVAYFNRAGRASGANDLDRQVTNLELTLPHYREAARIYRSVNRMDEAERVSQKIESVEERLRQVTSSQHK